SDTHSRAHRDSPCTRLLRRLGLLAMTRTNLVEICSKGTVVMDILPIRSEAVYRVALTEVERLWDAEPGTPEGDQAEILSILIEAYEAKHHPIPAPDPIAAILFMMEQKGLTRRDLEPIIGGRTRVSEILNRRRPLTLQMV